MARSCDRNACRVIDYKQFTYICYEYKYKDGNIDKLACSDWTSRPGLATETGCVLSSQIIGVFLCLDLRVFMKKHIVKIIKKTW